MSFSKEQNMKSPKKSCYNTRSKAKEQYNNKKLKNHKDSDSSDNDKSIYSSDSDENDDDEEMDMHEYRKYISKIFPSKFLTNKIKNDEKNKNKHERQDTENIVVKKCKNKHERQDTENVVVKKSKNNHKKNIINNNDSIVKKSKNNRKKQRVIEDESDSNDDYEYETIDEDDNETNITLNKNGKKGFNIIFTIGDPLLNDDDSENDSEEECDSDEEYESEEYESEEYESEEYESEEDDDEDDEDESNKNKESFEKQQETINEIKKTFESLLEKNPKNKIALEGIKDLELKEKKIKKQIDKKFKHQKTKNTKKFKDLINNKNLINDYKFFQQQLSIEEQEKLINEVEEINKVNIVQKPYRLTLLESDIPVNLKSIALNKISSLRNMEPGNGEYYKIKNWVDTFMKIPFNHYNNLPLSIENGIDECHSYMIKSKELLDKAVYGLNDAKLQIMQLVGQWISNPKAIGNAIAIKGPMGTGKTTLVKEGISKILNREFAFIALGGATDSSYLEGHSYTYEGSSWGKIVDILVKTKSMNPVFYFDELDKISDTAKGEEIAGILTHLTDTSQNSQFHDKYFSEIDFDLSKCLFIFSYNDESKVNPILLDRMYKIETQGYDRKDKRIIGKDYIIPKIIEQVNFKKNEIIVPDETIDYIVENLTENEKGVRNLKRCLEIIHTKINLYRLMKPESNLFEKEMTLKVEFPFTITRDIVRNLIKKNQNNGMSDYMRDTLYV